MEEGNSYFEMQLKSFPARGRSYIFVAIDIRSKTKEVKYPNISLGYEVN